jgi:transcriptional regulator with XRE-family HTH domain
MEIDWRVTVLLAGNMHRLRQWMKETGTTQLALASRMGVKQSTVSDWLNGKNWPSIEKLRELSLITGLSIDELVSEPACPSACQNGEPTTTGTHG